MGESDKEKAIRLAAIAEKIQGFYREPWKLYYEPFHVVGSIWYVGNKYVATYLIDTGDGLVLIDPGFKETIYLVFDGIRKLGFDPADIKHIFLSHGHVDHIGGTRFLQEYSGAKVWIGSKDAFFFTERRDLINDEDHVPSFEIHEYYDYTKEFVVGNTEFRFMHTPGHTPGCTSFFIKTTHREKVVIAAMHGGLGLNGLTYEELEEKSLPRQLQAEFVNQALRGVRNQKVDVVLASHPHNYDILERHIMDDGTGNTFIDPDGWAEMIDNVLIKAESVLPDQFTEIARDRRVV